MYIDKFSFVIWTSCWPDNIVYNSWKTDSFRTSMRSNFNYHKRMGGLRKRYCGVSIASTKCIWRSLVNFSERYHSPHDVRMLTERSYPIKRYLIISTKTTRKGHFISIPSLIASSFYISKWCCFLFCFFFFAFQTVYIESSFDRNTFLVLYIQ